MKTLQELHLEAIEGSTYENYYPEHIEALDTEQAASKSAEITLKFAIEQLELLKSKIYIKDGISKYHIQIEELKQQLKELEDGV
jgi:hypothetical protein